MKTFPLGIQNFFINKIPFLYIFGAYLHEENS